MTDKDFGIKLPSGATVVVEGNCSVSAAKYGISCPGSVTFKGTGKLTVTGGECGMYFYLSVREDRVLFLSGDYTVAGGEYGIRSDGAEISVCGGKTTFRGETAVSGVTVTFSDCESAADGGVYAQRLVKISGADLLATAENRAAIVSDGKIDVKDEKIEAGDAGALFAVDGYEGQSAVRFTSVYRRVRTSVLFGESVPGWVDVLVFTAAGLAAAAAIAVPLIRKKIKKKKLYERLGE